MSFYFLDSSALLKRQVREQRSRWVRQLTSSNSGDRLFVAAIVPVEVVSALARRRREGRLSERGMRNLRLLFDRQIARCYSVDLTDSVVQLACDLLERHSLRAYDAVQLASALESNARLLTRILPPLTFVSADQRLLTAANAEGLSVEDPNLHT